MALGGSAILLATLVVSVGAVVKWATHEPVSLPAIGRTSGSLVVICGDRTGRYSYLGLRLSDDAVLKTVARTTPTHEFIAQNASVTHSISPAELLVTAGGAVIEQEPMIDHRGPGT
jgi:hypothetical protein